jgi:hypothetical protein
MTPEETKMIADAVTQAVNNSRPQPSENAKMMDMLWKIASAAALGMLAWTVSTVNKLQQEVGNISKDQEYTTKAVEKFNNFTEKPRFTEDDFSQKIIPLTNQVNANTIELNSRDNFMEKTGNDIQKMQLQIQLLQSDLEMVEQKK